MSRKKPWADRGTTELDAPTQIKSAVGVLKSCPFCGNDKIAVVCCSDTMCDDKDCAGCRCRTYAVCCNMHDGGCGASSGYRQTVDEAVEAWNRRADNEQTETLEDIQAREERIGL